MTNDAWLVLRSRLDGGGAAGASPDIILGGPKPDPKYKQQYGTAFSRTGNFGGSNFVYVRAKNTGTDTDADPAVGSAAVYATHLGNLPKRGQWAQLHTSDGRNSASIAANAGGVAVTGAPLIWEPGAPPPPDAPWCLIAEITGDDYPPVDIPESVKDKQSFDKWIATQSRLAYVVVEAPHVVPVAAPTFRWEQTVSLANEAAATLSVSLTCTTPTAGGFLSYAFDAKDSSGQPIGIGKTRLQSNLAYSQSRTVPAGFSSKVGIAYTPEADKDAQADFVFQVSTLSGDGDGDGDGDLGASTETVVAKYTLHFGQARSGT